MSKLNLGLGSLGARVLEYINVYSYKKVRLTLKLLECLAKLKLALLEVSFWLA